MSIHLAYKKAKLIDIKPAINIDKTTLSCLATPETITKSCNKYKGKLINPRNKKKLLDNNFLSQNSSFVKSIKSKGIKNNIYTISTLL